MSNINDFVIEDGVLKKYIGTDAEVVVPEGVKTIAEAAFYESAITAITITNGVTEVGFRAFAGSKKLKKVIISDSVEVIGENSFMYCESLETVVFGNSIQKLGAQSFYGCSSLKTITLPETITVIENGLFCSCISLESITLPNNIKKIGGAAFKKCTALKEICIPESVVDVGEARYSGGETFANCESLERITIPKAVKRIQEKTFYRCKKIREVKIDAREIVLSDYAFGLCSSLQRVYFTSDSITCCKAFDQGMKSLTISVPIELYKVKSAISANILPYLLVETSADYAMLWMYQSGKLWDSWFEKQKFDACEVLREISNLICAQKKITPKQLQRLQEFVLNQSTSIPSELVDEIFARLMSIDSKTAETIKKKENEAKKKAELLNSIPLEKYFANNPPAAFSAELDPITQGVKYKDYDCNCSVAVIKTLLEEYLPIWHKNKREYYGAMSSGYNLRAIERLIKPDAAETIAAELDPVALSDYLEKLVFGKDYRYYAIPYARFATKESMARCTKEISARKKGTAKDKYWAESLLEAIYYSDANEAFEYIEKNGEPQRYAKLRGMSVQDWRDGAMITDLGFNSEGVRFCSAGDTAVSVQIQKNFELTLHDAEGKPLRSVSKKTPEGIKLAEEVATIKNEVLAFFQKRKDYIREIYITGEKISEKIWNNTYLKNPLFAPIVEAVIWQDGNNHRFEIKDKKILDINGTEFSPCGTISIAHVLDMTREEISAWQQHVLNSAKTLIVEQVWEPIFTEDTKKISSDRYSGTIWTNKERNDFKRALKQKGIEVKSAERDAEFDHRNYTYVFDPNGTMIIGNVARLQYVVEESTKDLTLGSISIVGGSNRARNAVLFELDKRSIKVLIRNNMSTQITIELLDSFTLAQINEFVELSTSCNSTDCTALLLEYKNNKYDTFDPFELFTLD